MAGLLVYWDASAFVPLLLREPISEPYRRLAREMSRRGDDSFNRELRGCDGSEKVAGFLL